MCQEVVVSNAKSFLPENVVAMLLFLTKNICRLEITPLKRELFDEISFCGMGCIIFCFSSAGRCAARAEGFGTASFAADLLPLVK